MNPISYSNISFHNGMPFNTVFQDRYFSTEGGLEEAQNVFVEHNYLEQRWKYKKNFCIGELGFGTGLNFFVTANAWRTQKLDKNTLYYFSVEKYPIAINDLKIIHKQWPEFQFIYETLYQYYPNTLPGLHRIEFHSLNIVLCLMIGDVIEQFSQIKTSVDAWYLDGFSPAKNQSMWSEDCFKVMADLSHQQTTFATFSSAGFVRRGLLNAGFEANKSKGYGKKREMLYGQFTQSENGEICKEPWFSIVNVRPLETTKKIAIVGAGLAGITTAWLLARQGVDVTVIEKNSQVGDGASGNPCGLVMPRFNNDFSLDTQFYYTALEQTVQWLNELKKQYPQLHWHQTGVIQLQSKENVEKTIETGYPDSFLRALSAVEVSELCGLDINSHGLFFPMAGYVSPRQLCQLLVDDISNRINLKLSTNVVSVEHKNNRWNLCNEKNELMQFDAVVIANSYLAESLLPVKSIAIEKNRGQLSILNSESLIGNLKIPLVYDAYLTPVLNSQQMLGASYAPDEELTPRAKDHEKNVQKLNEILSDKIEINTDTLEARVSFRAYSKDRMPVAGPVQNEDFYWSSYSDLHHGKKWVKYPDAEYLENMYVNIGHGSRGLVSCLASARLICDLITGQPITMMSSTISRIHPARFLIRQLKKPNS